MLVQDCFQRGQLIPVRICSSRSWDFRPLQAVSISRRLLLLRQIFLHFFRRKPVMLHFNSRQVFMKTLANTHSYFLRLTIYSEIYLRLSQKH